MTMTSASTANLLSVILDGPDTDEVGVRILDAALAEYLAHGFRRTSVDDVARRAGIGRATVYRRFATRDELVQAVLARETSTFFAGIVAATKELPTAAEQLVEGFVVGLRDARAQPLLQRMLIDEPEMSIPFLTTQGGTALAIMREFLLRHFLAGARTKSGARPTEIAEILARLCISLVLTPETGLPVCTDEEARETARRYLAPLVR